MRKRQHVYTDKCKDIEIMICKRDDEWEVYYRKTHYAWMFGFGLPCTFSLDNAFGIAKENVDYNTCKVLFDEEDVK